MKLKRTISGILSGAMLFTGIAIMPAANAETQDPIIKVDFDTAVNYTLNGTAALVDGRDGKALSLDGTSGSYADIGAIADTLASVSEDFTIGVWVKPDNVTTWSRVYDFGNGESGTYVFLTTSNGSNARLAITTSGNTAEQQLDASKTISAGLWHNVTITRKDGVSTFYMDGFADGTTENLNYNFSDIGKMQNYYLGKSQFTADPYFSGLIDDFIVYDRALSEEEVQTLAAEAYEREKGDPVSENNCYIINTEFYKDGNEIFSYSVDDGMYIANKTAENGKASYTVKNVTQDSDFQNLTSYVAQYDSLGKLIDVKLYKHSTADTVSSEENSRTVSFDYTVAQDVANTKLFVWNNMKPLTEGNITVSTSIENDTDVEGSVNMAVYAVASDGTETKLTEGEAQTLTSLDTAKYTLEVARDNIPSTTAKLVVKAVTDDESYDTASLYCGIKSPVAAPADSDTTTNGVHDPSIVKFPNDDTYYVYSSHHLIFTSNNLINWKKYDFTKIDAKDISPKTYAFISSNYSNTTMNGTYWAPDVIYKENDDHPYWMYISVSCGLGGRNSAIALMKSDSPLFWADENADIIDAGIVFATKESSSYVTNSIDANIYTDTDGQQYFIWGSFWGGIQAAKLQSDGFVEGVDYTSDSTILSSCAKVGVQGTTSVFTQKRGVAGPEGAWMINHGDYRYMFTSYGWLGSNYNTRTARAPLSSKFSENMSTQLIDANDVKVGQEYSRSTGSVKSSEITGYKLIGSYRLGDGSTDLTENTDTNDWYYPREDDDAHVYYGPGHNSAITADNGETFYVSHTRKDAVEIAATLQVRKMLWTADGWPVVSPVTYAGEVEQALPKELIVGTYDLASVGQTKLDGTDSINENWSNHSGNRNYDLPIISSKVILNTDGSMTDASGEALGTWIFDNDHTVTLTFTKDGDSTKDEFYKSGDVMTMYALLGYDKDEERAVVALTGTDQNHITQFATQPIDKTYKTPSKTIDTTPTVVTKSTGGNPELGFDADGNLMYGGDPSAYVEGDTVYLYVGHDTATKESYVIPEWACYSSKNMTDWTYEGVIMSASNISWASNTTSAWASQVTKYGDKYYFYYCTWDNTDSEKQSIGVAVSDSPTGPFTDKGTPIVKGSFTTPQSSNWNDIDPTVLISTDSEGTEHRYLAWGNSKFYICELNEDMISVKDLNDDNEITMGEDVLEKNIKSADSNVYTEAPWLYERNGKYYLFYAANWREEMAYAMADDPLGRWDYKQTIMPPTATSNTNHPAVIDFNEKTYFIYHNGALTKGSGFRRSVCIQELTFDSDGYVYPLTETSIGLDGTASVIKTSDGKYIAHNKFTNPSSDDSYPLSYPLSYENAENGYNTAWEIEASKYVPDGEDAANYVSIQSVNKPGLYVKAVSGGTELTQDADGEQGKAMTFKTVKGIDDENGVSFESVAYPNYYLTITASGLKLSSTGKNATFYIENASQKDETVINPADVENIVPDEDVSESFEDVSTGTIIAMTGADQTDNISCKGICLSVGSRSGGDSTTYWSIESNSGIDSSKALVMNNGKYVSSNRGPRMQLTIPSLPDGYTITGTFSVKLGGSTSELFYGDDTGTQGESSLTDKLSTSDWSQIKVTISNDNDVYRRTIYVGDTKIASDYVSSFPVFWGTATNNTSSKVYFDNVSITTVLTNSEG